MEMARKHLKVREGKVMIYAEIVENQSRHLNHNRCRIQIHCNGI